MMIRMSDDDIKLSDSIEKWYAFDKDGNYVLREDAPQEVHKIYEMLKEKYSWIES